MHIKDSIFIDEEKGMMYARTFNDEIVTFKIIYIPTYDVSEESIKECEELERSYEVN